MKVFDKGYQKYADARAQKSPIAKDCVKAFLFGGSICTAAQLLKSVYKNFMNDEAAGTLVSVTLIFITALLTGLGVFDKIAKHAGAGTLVPITGFANAVSSAAIDNRGEGFILGVGAKIFTVAGPVILYGTAAGAVYGVIYWAIKSITGA
ncbi:MAG: SpoVA/SpoVAEb family sporulation membrane protein [Clostridia bacterium]|nr:SpoVA/SpoVAEb family sporulation membrane protein [Clostridia bacterium]